MSERENESMGMSHLQPSIPPSPQGLEIDQKKGLVQQSRREVESDPVLEFVPTSQILINSSGLFEQGKNLDSKSFRQSPNISMETKNSHRKRELSPSSFIWRKSVRSPKLLETKGRSELNPESMSLVLMKRGEMPEKKQMEISMSEDLMEETNHHLQDQKVIDQGRRESCVRQTCLGVDEKEVSPLRTQAASSPPISSGNSTATLNLPNCTLNSHLVHRAVSPCQNGSTSSKGKPSTSTRSYRRSIVYLLMRRERLALEIQKLASAALKRRGRLRLVRNGQHLGVQPQKRLRSSLSTGNKSWRNMGTTLNDSSLPNIQRPMGKLSCSTEVLETKLEEDRLFCSPTINTSPHYMPLPCKTTALSTIEDVEEEGESQEARKMKSVFASMGKEVVGSQTQPANTCIPVWDVANQVTVEPGVPEESEGEVLGVRPKYLRYNLWSLNSDPKLTAASWTETALPLKRPSLSEFTNSQACRTIANHPDLFKVVTPINVSRLRSLTSTHPNRLFVDSVLEGLSNGFWPWADTSLEGYPVTHDESRPLRLSPEKEEFLLKQIEHERDLDRISPSFGQDLLPGMYCMPSFVVPKPHGNGWRLVNDFSAGCFSLNSMVDRQGITGYPLDNLSHLGELLLKKRKEKPEVKLVVWKSDVSEAYRICPMHKLWQIKQVIRVQGDLSVDRVNVFGGSSSGPIFISVNSLVAWVARFERLIESLVYVDDSFGVEESGKMKFYAPYDQWFPTQQTCLLELWDEIGFPHQLKKQIFGSILPVLGIEVDADLFTFSLPKESKDRLSEGLSAWSNQGVRKNVKEWQQIAGWMNWVFNVFPLLRPSLNGLYDKLKGKKQEARIWANTTIREDLLWAKAKLDESSGVRLFKSTMWEVNEATCIAETDACPQGFAFWYPGLGLGFATTTPRDTPSSQIIFYEALAVLSVLDDARYRFPSGSKLVIYCDNSVTVAMFNSLRALPEYNCILKAAVDILLQKDFQLRVLHISGERNDIADALSRADFMKALRLNPGLIIKTFQPYLRIDRRQLPPRLQPPRRLPLGVISC